MSGPPTRVSLDPVTVASHRWYPGQLLEIDRGPKPSDLRRCYVGDYRLRMTLEGQSLLKCKSREGTGQAPLVRVSKGVMPCAPVFTFAQNACRSVSANAAET